jgi:hypothetical protein
MLLRSAAESKFKRRGAMTKLQLFELKDDQRPVSQ